MMNLYTGIQEDTHNASIIDFPNTQPLSYLLIGIFCRFVLILVLGNGLHHKKICIS